jgi:hypothetical protein
LERIVMTRIFPRSSSWGFVAVAAAALLSTTAHAGEQTRAEAAIAEASGKIDAADNAGVGTMAPDLQRQAHEALMQAKDLLTNHKKVEALAAAQHASELADHAMAVANTRKAEADSNRRADQRAVEAGALQSAAMAQTRANSAEAATDAANSRAAAADTRANAAEQSSAAANAQVDAMRSAPPPVPAPTTTTVAMTEHDDVAPMPNKPVRHSPMHHWHHKVVHHANHTVHEKTTTAVVTTTHG